MSNALFDLAPLALILALQTIVPLGAGLLGLRMLRHAPPRLRCLAARLALGGVPLSLGLALMGAGQLPVLWHLSLESSVARTTLAATNAQLSRAPVEVLQSVEAPTPPDSVSADTAAPTPFSSSQRTVPEPFANHSFSPAEKAARGRNSATPRIAEASSLATTSRPRAATLWAGALALWLTGTVAGLSWLGLGCLAVWRVRRSARGVDDPAMLQLRGELCRSAGVRAPLLLESARVQGPFLCGLWRPAIVLPLGFSTQFDAGAAHAILAHEVAHLQRRDLWWQIAARLGCVLLWPQPLIWGLSRALEAAQEDACDEAVLETGCAPHDYARCLLDLADRLQLRPVERLAGLGVTPSRSALARRVTAILTGPRGGSVSTRQRRALVGGMALCVAASPLLIAAEKPAPDAAPVSSSSTPTMSTLRQQEEVISLAFSPDGRLWAQGGAEGEIRIYNAQTRQLERSLRGKSRQIHDLAWSPDGKTLANSHGELWDTATWRVWQKLQVAPNNPKLGNIFFNGSITWSPDGQLLASGGSYRTVMRRAGGAWKVVRRETSSDWIRDIQFSPDGRFLAEVGRNQLNVWDTATLGPTLRLKNEMNQRVTALTTRYRAVSQSKMPHAQREAGMRQLRRSYEAALGDLISSKSGEKVAFSPDGTLMAVAQFEMAESRADEGKDGKILIWDTRTWTQKWKFNLIGASASALAWSPDSRFIAAGEGELASFQRGRQKNEIKIWEVGGGRLLDALKGHTRQISALAWSPDGATLVSGSRDKTVRVWPVADLSAKSASPKAAQDERILSGKVRAPDLTTTPGGVVQGQVVDFDTGQPIAGVLVRRAGASRVPFSLSDASDAQGRYRVRIPAGKGRISIWGLPRGYLFPSRPFPVEVGEGQTVTLTLRLKKGLSLRGVALDAQGRAPRDAIIVATKIVPQWMSNGMDERPARLDARGQWRLDALSAGRYTLQVLDGWEIIGPREVEVPAREAVRLQLRPAPTLQGRVVTPQGQPIQGAKVQLDINDPTSGGTRSGSKEKLVTNAQGRFSRPRLRPDLALFLRVSKPGYRFVSGGNISRRKTSGGTQFEVRDIVLAPANLSEMLRPGAKVTGRVVYEDGRPARVSVALIANGDLAHSLRRTVDWRGQNNARLLSRLSAKVSTRADGSFAASNLPPLSYSAHVSGQSAGWFWAGEWRRNLLSVPAARGQTVRWPDMVLRRGAVVRLRAVDRDTGEALRGEMRLRYSNRSRIGHVESSFSTYAPAPKIPQMTVPPGRFELSVRRNPDGRTVQEVAYMTAPANKYIRYYDLTAPTLEVSVNGGPRQAVRDGRVGLEVAAGQTHEITYFLRRVRPKDVEE